MPLSPLNARRLANFRANRRGYWALWLFTALLVISLFAEFIANDRPLLISYEHQLYFPIFVTYPETAFGGFFETEATYTDPEVKRLIEAQGWMVWPLIPDSYDTVAKARRNNAQIACHDIQLQRYHVRHQAVLFLCDRQ